MNSEIDCCESLTRWQRAFHACNSPRSRSSCDWRMAATTRHPTNCRSECRSTLRIVHRLEEDFQQRGDEPKSRGRFRLDAMNGKRVDVKRNVFYYCSTIRRPFASRPFLLQHGHEKEKRRKTEREWKQNDDLTFLPFFVFYRPGSLIVAQGNRKRMMNAFLSFPSLARARSLTLNVLLVYLCRRCARIRLALQWKES